jgi:hypothetical protein
MGNEPLEVIGRTTSVEALGQLPGQHAIEANSTRLPRRRPAARVSHSTIAQGTPNSDARPTLHN